MIFDRWPFRNEPGVKAAAIVGSLYVLAFVAYLLVAK